LGIEKSEMTFMKEYIKKWYAIFLLVLIVVSFFASIIANDKPIYCKLDNQIFFPAINDWFYGNTKNSIFANESWKSKSLQNVIWSPIPFKYFQQNMDEALEKPFFKPSYSQNHWLGTDHLGRDIAAGLVNGTKTAILVGFGSIFLIIIIGFSLGTLSGYYGNNRLIVNKFSFVINSILILFGLIYLISYHHRLHEDHYIYIFLAVLLFSTIIINITSKKWTFQQLTIPIDSIILKIIELIQTIPKLLLLITMMAILERSIWTIILIIGIFGWTTIAKLTRAETLRITTLEYITIVQLYKLTDMKIIFKHILPNIFPPLLISLCFGVATAIMAEAGLSFLGLGLPANEVSWGSMLSESRLYLNSWWLLVFPGGLLFLTIYSLHKTGEFIRKKYLPTNLDNINNYY